MDILDTVNKFYTEMTIHELQLMNKNNLYPNINYNTFLYLELVYFLPNSTVTTIAETLNISKPAVTSKVNELISVGLVTKKQSQTDKRVFYLSVTKEVMKDFSKYDTRLLKVIKYIREKYTPQEIDIFCKVLDDISTKYSEEKK